MIRVFRTWEDRRRTSRTIAGTLPGLPENEAQDGLRQRAPAHTDHPAIETGRTIAERGELLPAERVKNHAGHRGVAVGITCAAGRFPNLERDADCGMGNVVREIHRPIDRIHNPAGVGRLRGAGRGLLPVPGSPGMEARTRVMTRWHRTSRSSLMSCWVEALTFWAGLGVPGHELSRSLRGLDGGRRGRAALFGYRHVGKGIWERRMGSRRDFGATLEAVVQIRLLFAQQTAFRSLNGLPPNRTIAQPGDADIVGPGPPEDGDIGQQFGRSDDFAVGFSSREVSAPA